MATRADCLFCKIARREIPAQIVYQDKTSLDVKYAYRDTNWFIETAASGGRVGDYTQFYFDENDNPIAIYFDRDKKALYSATRVSKGIWTRTRVTTSAGPVSTALNERTGHATLSWLNRPKTDVFSTNLL